MIARLNGSPLKSNEGDLRSCLKKTLTSVNAFVNEAIRKHPTIIVLMQVRPKSATFTQGNFRGGASSKNISADGLRELSMKPVLQLPVINADRVC
jgi:hypothetical protein